AAKHADVVLPRLGDLQLPAAPPRYRGRILKFPVSTAGRAPLKHIGRRLIRPAHLGPRQRTRGDARDQQLVKVPSHPCPPGNPPAIHSLARDCGAIRIFALEAGLSTPEATTRATLEPNCLPPVFTSGLVRRPWSRSINSPPTLPRPITGLPLVAAFVSLRSPEPSRNTPLV